MKKKISVGILLFVVAVISYQFMGPSDPLTSSDSDMTTDTLEKKVPVVTNSTNRAEEMFENSTSPDLPHSLEPFKEAIPENIQLIVDKKKRAIELLMHEFDNNLADVDMRKSIKIKIDKALAEYNEIILPLAVEQVKASN